MWNPSHFTQKASHNFQLAIPTHFACNWRRGNKREDREREREINKWQHHTNYRTKQSFHCVDRRGKYKYQRKINKKKNKFTQFWTLTHTPTQFAAATQTGAWVQRPRMYCNTQTKREKKLWRRRRRRRCNNNKRSSYQQQCVTSVHENFAEADRTTQRNWPTRRVAAATTTPTSTVRLNYAHTHTTTTETTMRYASVIAVNYCCCCCCRRCASTAWMFHPILLL